jgi:DNA polymerase-3 subunit gamma/tau
MIETDRLLELIDQFAAAEGRMKWAPNKRLHFEVAVIKAIQTLSQVTLNEVIENLAALRDGKQSPPPPRGVVATVSAAPPTEKPDLPRVAEQVQQTATLEKEAPPPKPEAATPVDQAAVWQKVVEQVRTRRRLISPWVEAATALGTEGRFFVVGFPPQQKTAMESLSIPRTREFLEALLKEISGHAWDIKFVLKEGLAVAAAVETPVAAPAPKKQETQATFKDDPLIREALEIFKGEIKTVSD